MKILSSFTKLFAWCLVPLCAVMHISAQTVNFPTDPGIINVKNAPYNAVGDGVADDTAAIQAAISDWVGKHEIIYFPNGIYKISNSLVWKNTADQWKAQLTLQGQSRTGTIIRLADNAAGFTVATTPKPMIQTGSANPTDVISGAGNQAFRNNIKNLTVHTGSGNVGAVGIDYLTNNLGVLREVTVVGTGGGHTGIRMNRSWPGPGLITGVSVSGFQFGITSDNHYQYSMTLENVTLSGQSDTGIRTAQNPLFIRKLTSTNTVPAIRLTGDHALVVLKDSTLTGGIVANSAIVKKGKLWVKNTTFGGYGKAIDDTATANLDLAMTGSSFVAEQYTSNAVEKEWTETPDKSLDLPIEATPTYTDGPVSDWANGLNYGMTRNGSVDDDTVAIQAAMNSGKATVYLPRGQFYISDTITIPATVRHVLGANTSIDQKGTNFNTASSPRPVFKVIGSTTQPLILENLWVGGSFGAGTIGVEHASTRTLVILSTTLSSLSSKHSYVNSVSGGKLFLEDVLATRVVITGDQQVWGRQVNAEFGTGVQLVNNGGTVWMLGYKTEGSMGVTETTNGGFTEMLGGFIYPNGGDVSSVGAPIHTVTNANFSGSWVTNQYQYSRHVAETRGTETRTLWESEVPTRGGQENVVLYTGYTETLATGYAPTADAYVHDGTNAAVNFGTSTDLHVKSGASGYNRRSYLKFNLAGLASSTTQARLQLTVSSVQPGVSATTPATILVYAVPTDTWTEAGLTWNNRPATGTQIASLSITGPGDYEVDITSYVSGEMGGDKVASICLAQQTGQDKSIIFSSKEGASGPLLSIQ